MGHERRQIQRDAVRHGALLDADDVPGFERRAGVPRVDVARQRVVGRVLRALRLGDRRRLERRGVAAVLQHERVDAAAQREREARHVLGLGDGAGDARARILRGAQQILRDDHGLAGERVDVQPVDAADERGRAFLRLAAGHDRRAAGDGAFRAQLADAVGFRVGDEACRVAECGGGVLRAEDAVEEVVVERFWTAAAPRVEPDLHAAQ